MPYIHLGPKGLETVQILASRLEMYPRTSHTKS